ncbi:hypothetical protein Mgra_00000961, partial [Meloidogyne graminicola]
GVENQKALKSLAIIGNTTNAIKNWVNNFFTNSIMSTSIVVGCILLSGNQLLWMEELFVCSNNCRLQIHHYCTRNMSSISSLREKSRERIILSRLFRRHTTVRLNSMF